MKKWYFSGFLFLLLVIAGGLMISKNISSPLSGSFESFFRVIGQPFKTFDRGISKLIGVEVNDERALGNVLKDQYQYLKVNHPAEKYINSVIQLMAAQYNPKELEYQVFVIDGPSNAAAMPGGLIFITTGMLELITSEAELVSVLAHEKGHIDLGHCIDSLKGYGNKGDIGSDRPFYAGFLNDVWSHHFSKFQENEADQFGYETLIALQYDYEAMGRIFGKMEDIFHEGNSERHDVFSDYFSTHPSLIIRAENWLERAKRKKRDLSPGSLYVGEENYKRMKSRDQEEIATEWQ